MTSLEPDIPLLTAPLRIDVRSELSALIAQKDFSALKLYLNPWLASDLAPIAAGLTIEELAIVFRHASHELAAATFAYLPGAAQRKLLKTLSQEQAASLLNELAHDDRTRFLNEQPIEVAMQMIGLLPPDKRHVAQTLLAYPPYSVGRMMTLDYVAIPMEVTVGEALDHIRKYGFDRETLETVFVVDNENRLIDDLRVRRILLSSPERPIRQLLDGSVSSLLTTDDREKALAVFRQLDRVALPVVDDSHQLVGIVTIDDMLDVAEAEATEDIHKLGGSDALDEPYTTIALARMVRKRAGWLLFLFLGEMLTATAMTYFEDEIARAVVLALFVPLVISSGGNAGSQASTLVIRAMALGELTLRDWWRVMRREAAAGLMLGLILGAVGFIRIAIWAQFTNIYGRHWPLIALTVGGALVGIVLWGSLIGSMLPLALRRLGFDPATSSAPFVATLVDVTGLIIYFSVAYLALHGTLL